MAIQHPGSATSKPANLILTIIWTWFLVGTLDGCGATINYLVQGGKDATLIFRYIASAVFGIEAYSGGTGMVLMGILFHYINALLFTIFFFLIARRMKWLSENKLVAAILYGIFMWLVMTFLVLPLTKIPPGVVHFKPSFIGISILIMAIGIPLSYISASYYSRHSRLIIIETLPARQ